MNYTIRHDYMAIRSSGSVPKRAKLQIMLHSIESGNLNGAAEGTGAWFENPNVQGSTHFGVDCNSIQQYLPVNAIAWGAPYENRDCIHIEQVGYAKWSRSEWLKTKEYLDRVAWLLAKLCKEYGIPIRVLTDDQVRRNVKGIMTHGQATRVHKVAGGHVDPGPGYPMDWVIKKAKLYYNAELIDKTDIISLKRMMRDYAYSNDVKIPYTFAVNKNWGDGAKTLAWRISGRLGIGNSTKYSIRLYSALLKWRNT